MNPEDTSQPAAESSASYARETFLDFDTSDRIDLDIKSPHNIYYLTRLSDREYFDLGKHRLPILVDYTHLISLSMDRDLIYSSFSRMYAALKNLFGPSGNMYDDWKGSFSFVFLIRFQKDGQEFGYLLNIFNMRSGIEFCFYKLISADDRRFERSVMQRPFEDFPQDEMNYMVNYICGYCTGYFNVTEKHNEEYFLLVTESNLILSGCHGQVYFDNDYETPEEFQAARTALAIQCTPPPAAQQ